jgi:aspartate aminotransferase
VLDDAELEAVAEVARKADLLVLSDEIYERILYDGRRHRSVASLPGMGERTLTFNGFSKAFAMTGWRLGYVAGPLPYLGAIRKIHGHAVTCVPAFVQAAGLAALSGTQGFVEEMRVVWDRRRRRVSEGLSSLPGVRCPLPEGAFYAFADVRGTGMGSVELADRLVSEAHVVVTPGVAFGQSGEGHVRMALTTADAALDRAIERIRRILGGR